MSRISCRFFNKSTVFNGKLQRTLPRVEKTRRMQPSKAHRDPWKVKRGIIKNQKSLLVLSRVRFLSSLYIWLVKLLKLALTNQEKGTLEKLPKSSSFVKDVIKTDIVNYKNKTDILSLPCLTCLNLLSKMLRLTPFEPYRYVVKDDKSDASTNQKWDYRRCIYLLCIYPISWLATGGAPSCLTK